MYLRIAFIFNKKSGTARMDDPVWPRGANRYN